MMKSSLLRIHISFDGWTTPNYTLIIGVYAHFLASNLTLKHPLLGLKFIKGRHTREGLVEVITQIKEDYEIKDSQLGVYITDNASLYTTYIAYLVSKFYPREDTTA